MRRLWLQVAQTSGATLVSVAGTAASIALTARLLGPDGRGLYAAATSWAALFVTFASLSLGQVAIHHVAGRPARDWYHETTGSLLALSVLLAAIGWGVAALLYVATGGALFQHLSPTVLAIALLPLPLAIWTDAGRYVLNALEGLGAASAAQVASTLVSLLGMLVFVVGARAGVVGAVSAVSAGSIVLGALVLGAVLRRKPQAGTPRADRRLMGTLLRGSARLHLNAVGNYLFTQASVLVLNYYRPPEETGLYQMATQLFSLTLLVSSAVGTVAFGLVARLGPDGAWPEQRRLMAQALGAAAVLALLGYYLAPLGVRIVAGERFAPAVPLFRLLLPALVGATFSTVMGSQWIGRGFFVSAALLTLAVGLVSLASDLLLVPRYGMRGATVSTLITYGVSVVGNGAMALYAERSWRRSRAANLAVPA